MVLQEDEEDADQPAATCDKTEEGHPSSTDNVQQEAVEIDVGSPQVSPAAVEAAIFKLMAAAPLELLSEKKGSEAPS